MFNKIKGFFKKENLQNMAWNVYLKLRKGSFSGEFDPELVKKIPPCAIASVFGNNKVTKAMEEVITGVKDNPTHTFLYLGEGEHVIAEADVFFSKNKLERYAQSRIAIHYFKDLTVEEMGIIKDRIYYLLSKKMTYDVGGYLGFASRLIPFLSKIKLINASDKTVFCSDAAALVYQGDETNTDDKIKTWNAIRNVSLVDDPNKVTPAHIYQFLHGLSIIAPNKVVEIVLEPSK